MTKYNIKKTAFFIISIINLPLMLYWFVYDLQLMIPGMSGLLDKIGVYELFYKNEAITFPGVTSILFLAFAFIAYTIFYRKELSFFGRTLVFLSAVLIPKATVLIDTSIGTNTYLTGKDWFIPLLVFVVIMFETALELIFAMKRYPKE